MRLVQVRSTSTSLVGTLKFDGNTRELYYTFEGSLPLAESADAFVVGLLLPAMRRGEALQIEAPISPVLADSLPRVQEIFARWFSGIFSPIQIEVEGTTESASTSLDAGTFFSLGVDSFYTALNAPACRYLIYMRSGAESLAEDTGQHKQVEATIQTVARELGKQVISGNSNYREVFQISGDDWGQYYHGAGLAAIGHALGLDRVYISSTHAINHLLFWGSHPAVDHLWSSGRTKIVHFGNVSRAEKTLDIVQHPTASRNLRVCVHNDGGEANCGRCWKCIRTMITLQILGKLEGSSFPYDGRPLAAELDINDANNMAFAEELEDLLLRVDNPDRELLALIQTKLNRERRKRAITDLVRGTPKMRAWIRRLRGIAVEEPPKLPTTPVPAVTVRTAVR